jgi:hypothetical protein
MPNRIPTVVTASLASALMLLLRPTRRIPMQREQGRVAVMSLPAAAFALALAALAACDPAEAGKGITASGSRTYSVGPVVRGGVSKPPTTGTAKANPPRIVRTHGDEKVFAPPQRGLLPPS